MPSVKVEHVFLDMDGVITDFVSAICEKHERPNPFEDKESTHRGHYDLHTPWNITPKEFWEPIKQDPKFWAQLKKTRLADPIINDLLTLKEKYGFTLYIVSSPSLCPSSHYGKAAWVQKHYPQLSKYLILTNHKHLMSKAGTLLIDDSDANVNAFRDPKAAYSAPLGKTILVPQPWNSRHHLSHVTIPITRVDIGRAIVPGPPNTHWNTMTEQEKYKGIL